MLVLGSCLMDQPSVAWCTPPGRRDQPVRAMVPVADHQRFLGLLSTYGSALGVKLVAFYPENQQVPTHHAVVVLFKPETDASLVTMDGRLITELSTAAVSAVATQYLARQDAEVLASRRAATS